LFFVTLFGVVLTVAGFWSYRELDRATRLRGELNESFVTRNQIEHVFSLLQDVETGQRGFLLTGDPIFLKPYENARAELPSEMALLQRHLSDPHERPDMAEFAALADQKQRQAERLVEMRSRNAPIDEALTRESKATLDALRRAARRMGRAEDQRIDAMLAEDRLRSQTTSGLVAFLFGALAMSAVAAGIFGRRYLKARNELLAVLRQEADRQRGGFESALDGILTIDRSGVIESANPAAARIFARDVTSLVGRKAEELSESFHDLLAELWADPALGATGLRRRVEGLRNGSEFPMEASLAIVRLDEGQRVIAFVRDLSGLQEATRAKDEFVSTVSHELRTPLTSIAGSLGLVASGAAGPLPEKAARLVGIAQSNSQRLVRLINDILDLEKLESGKLSFIFAPIDLTDVARRAIDGVSGYADQLGVELVLDETEPVPVNGDTDRLVQVVTNLLSNAVKFSSRGGAVTVHVVSDGTQARLSVIDRGPGVPENFRDRIFSRFAQADGSDARGKSGTGLGLYIAKEIAERHGGRLWFQSPAEGGATFHLDLPLLTEAAQPEPVQRDRVLLVEDEAIAATVLTDILMENGLKVDAVETLAEARERLSRAERYGALILDLRLPDGDGMELVRELRARPDTRGMPVVIVSGDVARRRDPDVRPLEVTSWMEKPVDPDRLTGLVRSAVLKAASRRSVILHIDDDRDIREVVAAALSGSGEVLSADGLAEARRILGERRPDVVIVDPDLNGESGLDILKDLQQAGRVRPLTVLFTAADMGAAPPGVDAVLVKSRTPLDKLAEAVGAMVRTRRPDAA
jgi:PAS domain S-box-containing protein